MQARVQAEDYPHAGGTQPFGGLGKKPHNSLELQVIHAAIHHGHWRLLPKSYQSLTKILPFLSPVPSILHLLINSDKPWEAYTHRGAVGSRRFGWATSCRNGRATVLWLWAASGMSIESSDVLPILGRNSQGTSRTREGQTCCRRCRHGTTRILDEMHAGSTEATAGEEKNISVRIEVS